MSLFGFLVLLVFDGQLVRGREILQAGVESIELRVVSRDVPLRFSKRLLAFSHRTFGCRYVHLQRLCLRHEHIPEIPQRHQLSRRKSARRIERLNKPAIMCVDFSLVFNPCGLPLAQLVLRTPQFGTRRDKRFFEPLCEAPAPLL
ncbi:hypothetical protein OKW29_000204 [Paraburkholderia sp. CI3]